MNTKFGKLTTFYVVIAVFLCVLSVFSFTYAWYVKTSTYSVGITFARPINITITNDIRRSTETISSGDIDDVLPGTTLDVNLSVSMDTGSSPAYIRARMVILPEVVEDANGQPIDWESGEYIVVDLGQEISRQIQNQNADNPELIDNTWIRSRFNNEYWYVLATGANVAKEMRADTTELFITGKINFTGNLDNRFASKSVQILFEVEAIQVKNIENPLTHGSDNATWGA